MSKVIICDECKKTIHNHEASVCLIRKYGKERASYDLPEVEIADDMVWDFCSLQCAISWLPKLVEIEVKNPITDPWRLFIHDPPAESDAAGGTAARQ